MLLCFTDNKTEGHKKLSRDKYLWAISVGLVLKQRGVGGTGGRESE